MSRTEKGSADYPHSEQAQIDTLREQVGLLIGEVQALREAKDREVSPNGLFGIKYGVPCARCLGKGFGPQGICPNCNNAGAI